MSLSNKLIADYVELINHKLDGFQVENVNDFPLIITALEAITREDKSIPPALLDRVIDVREMLDHPEDYVQDQVNYPEYKEIILKRVSEKINELVSLSSQQQVSLIEEQKKLKEVTIKHQELMKGHTPPAANSEAHVEELDSMGWLSTLIVEALNRQRREREPVREPEFDPVFVNNLQRAFPSTETSRERRAPRASLEETFAYNLRQAFMR